MLTSWVDRSATAHRAATAEQALDAHRSANPCDIALCDVSLPGETASGWPAQIRERYPHTAIIMATGARDIGQRSSPACATTSSTTCSSRSTRAAGRGARARPRLARAAAGAEELQHALQDRLRTRRAAVAAALAEAQEPTTSALEGLIAMLQLHERDGRGHAGASPGSPCAMADELGLDDDDARVTRTRRAAARHRQARHAARRSSPSRRRSTTTNGRSCGRIRRSAMICSKRTRSRRAPKSCSPPRGVRRQRLSARPRRGTDSARRADPGVADSYDSMTHPHTQRPPMLPAHARGGNRALQRHAVRSAVVEALGTVLVQAMEDERTGAPERAVTRRRYTERMPQ